VDRVSIHIQQKQFANRMRQAGDQLSTAQKRGNFQSSGAYMGAKGQQGTSLAQGLSDIEQVNQYKNATLARDDRLRKQQRGWQVEDRDMRYRKQDEERRRQEENQWKQMIGGAVGTAGSMVLGPAFGAAGNMMSNQMQYQSNTSPQQDWYTQHMNSTYNRPTPNTSGPYRKN
jgi:hypothetical protein